MLETLRNDPKGQRLDFGHRLVPVLPVAQYARQGRHFSQPAAICFAFQLDGEGHRGYCIPTVGCPTSGCSRRRPCGS